MKVRFRTSFWQGSFEMLRLLLHLTTSRRVICNEFDRCGHPGESEFNFFCMLFMRVVNCVSGRGRLQKLRADGF